MAITEREFEQANARMQALRQAGHAVAVRYDKRSACVIVSLNTGVRITFPAALAEGLADATPSDLSLIEISPTGLALHWPCLDADVYVPALLQGVFGSQRWMAAQLGQMGGRVRSAVKAATARENGSRGGRPRKSANG
jgi:hypothetical protein